MINHPAQIGPSLHQRSLRGQPILHPQRLHLAVLDERIRDLWRQGRVRLVAISDPQSVPEEQLNESLPEANETIFYLEAAHEIVDCASTT